MMDDSQRSRWHIHIPNDDDDAVAEICLSLLSR